MPVISGSCCGTVWYCTPAGPVELAVGTAPPAGFTGGPWATAAEARGCPVPDVVIPGYGCAPNPLTVPGAVWFNLTAMTGSLGSRLPASVRVALSNPGSGGGLMGSTAIVDRTNPARTYTFYVNLTCLASNYRIELYILPTPTAGTVTLSAGTSPWARNTGGVFWEWFNLTTAFPAGAWPLSAPEPVGTWTDPDAFGTLALVMSR